MNKVEEISDDDLQIFSIEGLRGVTEFINKKRERRIIDYLDKREWTGVSSNTGRQVQQFGYLYDYKSRNAIKRTDPLEDDIQAIAKFLIDQEWLNTSVDKVQCIANQYFRNQGITGHIDSLSFGDTIVSISLLEDTVMTFTKDEDRVDVLLPRRSIVILTNEARYDWNHSISPNVKYTTPRGIVTKAQDYRRVSLTYRFVK